MLRLVYAFSRKEYTFLEKVYVSKMFYVYNDGSNVKLELEGWFSEKHFKVFPPVYWYISIEN
ncbi:hypothetical protein TSYNTROOL_21570 [Tepidanaerobacter syntrophicus]|nr:hypothetical protein TSYNTROOL_21570 [Tepidanaerobacter syntrophicus]